MSSCFATDPQCKIFGVTTTPKEIIPSNGEYSLFLTIPASTSCIIDGSVAFRNLTSSYINISWELFRDSVSITQGKHRLFAMYDPNVSSTAFREKTVNYKFDDTEIKISPESKNNIIYKLTLYNYSTSPDDTKIGKPITIDVVSFIILAQLTMKCTDSLHPSIYLYQHNNTLNNGPINQSIPPNDVRTINLQTITAGGNCKIQGSISIANVSLQNFRPILEIDIVRDKKISLLDGSQIILSAPTTFIASETGRSEFLTSFEFVDQNVPIGIHEYQLILKNQSIDAKNQPTFLELFVTHFSALVPVIESFCIANRQVQDFHKNKMFLSSSSCLTELRSIPSIITIGSNQFKRFNIQVPRNIKQALIKGLFNMGFQHSNFEIQMTLLRDGEIIPEFGENQIIQVPFSALTYEMQHSIPLLFIDTPSLHTIVPDFLQNYTYSIEIYNRSKPAYDGADVTIFIHWFTYNILYIYENA